MVINNSRILYKHPVIIVCMRPANEIWHSTLTPALIGWAHRQNDPWGCLALKVLQYFWIFHQSFWMMSYKLNNWLKITDSQGNFIENIINLLLALCLLMAQHQSLLTLKVWGPSYLCLTRSISWLLMPWFLMSPGHQQPWYWLCTICRSWSCLRKDFKCLCHIKVD